MVLDSDIPIFEPIEQSWAYGESHVGLNFDKDCDLNACIEKDSVDMIVSSQETRWNR